MEITSRGGYFQQFEKEQEERRKAESLKSTQRREERALAQQNRTSLLGGGLNPRTQHFAEGSCLFPEVREARRQLVAGMDHDCLRRGLVQPELMSDFCKLVATAMPSGRFMAAGCRHRREFRYRRKMIPVPKEGSP